MSEKIKELAEEGYQLHEEIMSLESQAKQLQRRFEQQIASIQSEINPRVRRLESIRKEREQLQFLESQGAAAAEAGVAQ